MSKHADSRGFERAPAPDFDPVPVRSRFDGWTAERQRRFIQALCETGCVSQAAAEVGMTARSAYRLAARPDAQSFARAWAWALSVATPRLTALAFDYAIHGMSETVWKDGVCVYERRRPSEKLLMFLLSHLDPTTFGRLASDGSFRDFREVGVEAVPGLLEDLHDVPPEDCEVDEASPDDLAEDDPEHGPRA
jgi:hypothetical protein